MSKRSATEVQTTAQNEGQAYQKASGSGVKRENVESNGMGEFEDAWEDEIESDEEIVDSETAGGDDGMLLRSEKRMSTMLNLQPKEWMSMK